MGQFQPGNKMGGRKKGAKNKRNKVLLENIEKFLSARFKDLEADWSKLSAKDRWKLFIDLSQFALPKKAAVSNQHSIDGLTEEQADELLEQLKQSVIR